MDLSYIIFCSHSIEMSPKNSVGEHKFEQYKNLILYSKM